MGKESILYGVIGLLAGIVITGFGAAYAVNNDYQGMMRMFGMDTTNRGVVADHSTMSMEDMAKKLEKLSGDDFDKAFVEMMISHHEGAVNMAEFIPSRAKHDEVKKLGEAIIAAQTKEIADMKQWQKDWGYSVDESIQMMH